MTFPKPDAERIALLLVLAALLSGFAIPVDARGATPASAAHHSAPGFSRMDLNHHPVSLTAYRGKVILLNFWATWCAPCLTEMPRFVEWQQQYAAQGLQVIGISMDDEATPVRAFYQTHALNYPVVMGDEKLGGLYGGIFGLPVTFLIDRNGKIRFKHQGATDLNVIDAEMRTLLQAQ